jgi:hypothetical protein
MQDANQERLERMDLEHRENFERNKQLAGEFADELVARAVACASRSYPQGALTRDAIVTQHVQAQLAFLKTDLIPGDAEEIAKATDRIAEAIDSFASSYDFSTNEREVQAVADAIDKLAVALPEAIEEVGRRR